MSDSQRKLNIDTVEPTSDNLTSRAGLCPFVRYLDRIGIYRLLQRYFGSIRKSSKGIAVKEAFKQLLCFFVDGTHLHMSTFDERARDLGYAATIETDPGDMVSSHQ